MSTDTTTPLTFEQAADLIGTGPEHLTPTMLDLVQRVQDGERCSTDAARLTSRLITRTASLRSARERADELKRQVEELRQLRSDAEVAATQARTEAVEAEARAERARADAEYLRRQLHDYQQLARDEQRQRLALADRVRRDEDAVEIGRRELARRERRRLRLLADRRRGRQQVLRQEWAREIQALPQRQRSICPTGPDRALRRRCGEGGHVGVVVVPGRQAPVSSGKPGGWFSESGLTRVTYPSAYSRAGGRPQYVCSTETIEVGRGWLRDHLGGLAQEQAAVDVR